MRANTPTKAKADKGQGAGRRARGFVDDAPPARQRTGALAVDNSDELPTAHPFAHKLHRLLPTSMQSNPKSPFHSDRGQLG